MHIEPTSRCTLACPGCPRTWFSETFNRPFPKQDLDLDSLVRFLDCNSGKEVTEFLINGNHGDPIYYPRLFDLIDTFRQTKSYQISTAGSHQTQKFWEGLANRLTAKDTIYFSVDGLEHNNHLYRRNSNWQSIMSAIDIMRTQSSARIVWKTLIFSYNQHEINQIQDLAESKGLEFIANQTARFGDESLKPSENLIDTSRLYEISKNATVIHPQCLVQEYISADGYYWPCCLITSYFTLHKTSLWRNRNDWKIDNRTLDQLRKNLLDWQDNIRKDPENAHSVCKMNCKPGQKFGWPYT